MNTVSKYNGSGTNLFCPECGFVMEKGDNFCYHCRKFVDWEQGRVLNPEEVTDSMLDSLILRSSAQSQTYQQEAEMKKYKTGFILIGLGILMFITLILFFVGIILIIVGIFKIITIKNAPKGYLSPEEMSSIFDEYIVPSVLRENLDLVEEYQHDKGISTIKIHKIHLMQKPYNKMEGTDYIKAVHKGISFEMADTVLTREYQKAGGIPASEPVFKGNIFIAPLKVSIPEDITIWEKNPSGTTFDEKYHVESRHPETAADFLTSERKQMILYLDDATDSQITIKFTQDGFLCIACATNRDLFAVFNNDQSASLIRERFRQEAIFISNIVTLLSYSDFCLKQNES